MGTYYNIHNYTRREFIRSHYSRDGAGAKWREVMWPGSGPLTRVAALLQSGQWSPEDRIEAVSDRSHTDYYDVIESSQDPNDPPDDEDPEDFPVHVARAIAAVGLWKNVSRREDGVVEEWDDAKAEVIAPLADANGWYEGEP